LGRTDDLAPVDAARPAAPQGVLPRILARREEGVPVRARGSSGTLRTTRSPSTWTGRTAKDLCGACGYGGAITVKPQHRIASIGIPTYLHGHGKSGVERIVDEIHAARFLTAQDGMRHLGRSDRQISRLIKVGLK
jgi:hypothetical protein